MSAKRDPSLPPVRVLVAEDNPTNVLLIKAILKNAGYGVTCVMNGREAVDIFSPDAFDVILMDMHMPELDGFEAAAAIRQKPGGESIPIIAVTAANESDLHSRSEGRLINGYISKPLRAADLFAMIESQTSPGLASEGGEPKPSGGTCLDRVLDHCDGDRELARQIIDVSLRQFPEHLSLIETHFHGKDGEAVHRVAHKFKGTFATLGILPVVELLARLEKEAIEGRWENAGKTIEQLRGDLLQCERELRETNCNL